MKQWAAVKDGVVVHGGFDAPQALIDGYPAQFAAASESGGYVPPWYDESVEFVDVSGVDPRPVEGFYKAGNGRWVDGNPTLTADRYTIPADGTTAATVTFTQKGPQAPAEVAFDVNGQTVTEPLATDKASVEVVSSNPGDEITVSAGGRSVTITVEA